MAHQQVNNQPIRVRVNRAFHYGGAVKEIGTELALPGPLAAELHAAGKVERADRDPSDDHKDALARAKARAAAKAGAGKVAKA